MRSLAIIENDAGRALRLVGALESAGFQATVFTAARPALPLLREQRFALALVDLAIADVDPFSLCREIGRLVPTIALARESAAPCVRALESGADDCICRDVPDRELIARIRNLLRRAEVPVNDRDVILAALAEMRVRVDGTVHDLTAGETALLAVLLDRAPRPMTILELAQAMGANRGTVEARIKSLRKKLGPRRLVSRGRLGYQIE